MSCTVERDSELDAPPAEVWDDLPALFEDDAEHDLVLEEQVPGQRLSFLWSDTTNDEPASYVEIELEPQGAIDLANSNLTGFTRFKNHIVGASFKVAANGVDPLRRG